MYLLFATAFRLQIGGGLPDVHLPFDKKQAWVYVVMQASFKVA
jgi:hypothetical protein